MAGAGTDHDGFLKEADSGIIFLDEIGELPMEAQGLLRFEEGGKARRIYPALTREEASRSETNTLIDKVFKGSPGLLMASLLDQTRLSHEEIDGLYAMLKKAEEERNA